MEVQTSAKHSILKDKGTRLYLALGGFFVVNALIAEFIGIKIFSLEGSLGFAPLNWQFFGHSGSLQFTAGVLLWPVVFVMTDIINEYFGRRGVKFLSYLAVALIAYAFLMVFVAVRLAPAEWWITTNAQRGVPDMQLAFANIFGQSMFIIVGSLVAFLVGQLLDVFIFHKIKALTGESKIWLRATGSTLISQFIDSFVVLYIAFVGGPALVGTTEPWPMAQFLSIGIVNYLYKFFMAIALTPVIYVAHYFIERHLGQERAEALRQEAQAS
jgi:uncharacterized integral membrane protein (TIGR00697 family)